MKVGLDTSSSCTSVFERLHALSKRKPPSSEWRGQPSPTKQPRPQVELRLEQQWHHSQAKLRQQRVRQALKTQATCTNKPRIEPFSRYLAGLPKGEEAELARERSFALAHALRARVTGKTTAPAATVGVRVCLQPPRGLETPQASQRSSFSRVTSTGIPYESLPLSCIEPAKAASRTEDCLFGRYVSLTPSCQAVHFPSGMNFQSFLAKARPLVKYNTTLV